MGVQGGILLCFIIWLLVGAHGTPPGTRRNVAGIRMQAPSLRIPPALIYDFEDTLELAKRQFDDYGHMRFGKRATDDKFDDYGHMRFGKR